MSGCLGSGHNPVSITIKKKPTLVKAKFRQKWILSAVDWQQWREGLLEMIWEESGTLEEVVQKFESNLCNFEYVVQKTKGE